MIKSAIVFGFICASTLFSAEAMSEEASAPEEDCCCGPGPRHMRAGLRYTTPRGIGYSQGYTTLEGFFAPQDFLRETWLPFMDLRGHVFDNGKFAANAGLGLRYLTLSRVWGANAYYDYRNTTHHQHYNQVSAGLESLGRVWDFRINGYLPVGKTHTPFSGGSFFRFQGHHLLLQRSRNFAMKGANAEAGAHVDHFEKAPLYFAGGPYYLTGVGETTWGGELRGTVDLFDRYVRVEGNVSYDHFFKWIGQAQVSINIPFGGRTNVIRRSCNSCCKEFALQTRAVQRVDRNEIIPVVNQHSITFAIDPATGQPWFFWFVNNTSSSNGTFESPYPTLVQAQNPSLPNQVIYVYPGDGTTTGMDAGIILKDNQMLLGASVSHPLPTTVGTILIPPMASSAPNITNLSGDVVTLANSNTVSGFNILASFSMENGIAGTGISNLLADRNTFTTNTTDTNGISLLNPSGQIIVTNSSFTGFLDDISLNNGNGIYVELDAGNTLNTLTLAENSFIGINSSNTSNNGGNGLYLNLFDGTIANLNISDSIFNTASIPALNLGNGLFANLDLNGSITTLNISDTTFTGISNNSDGVLANLVNGTIANMNVSESVFNGITGGSNGINALLDSPGPNTITTLSVSGCTFTGINGTGGTCAGITADIQSGSTIPNMSVTGNIFSGISIGSLGLTYATSSSGNLVMTDNLFNGILDSSRGLQYHSENSSIVSAEVTGNTFSGSINSGEGFGSTITVTGHSTMCLEFTNNNGTPVGPPDPYFFDGSLGTFNTTDNLSTNTGLFSLTNVHESSCP